MEARAFVSQRPFLMQGTVKQNILFGEDLEMVAYSRVLDQACLVPDLKELRDGDETQVRRV